MELSATLASSFDMVVVGGGPAGLSLACLAADRGLHVAVVERQGEGTLADAPPDGRDIALTHRSVRILGDMGVWSALAPGDIAPIRRAAVKNADEAQLLTFASGVTGRDALGYLVGNNILRREIYRAVRRRSSIALITGEAAKRLDLDEHAGRVTLGSGSVLRAPLVVGSDSRLSELRRMAGIGAEMRDFGHLCIVCRLSHEQPHDGTAYEWFDVDQTLAVLPLNGLMSSIVLTQAASVATRTLALTDDQFAAQIERRLSGRWGRMTIEGKRHAYPLVAVYAHRFAVTRFALVGDAAVGMHPVTAHGFNFGLRGAETLAAKAGEAAKAGGDIGAASVLDAYAQTHRRATLPLYLATNAIVRLYTDNTGPARLIRRGLLRAANAFSPAKDLMLRKLTEIDGELAST